MVAGVSQWKNLTTCTPLFIGTFAASTRTSLAVEPTTT
jgi:hypothetical protein